MFYNYFQSRMTKLSIELRLISEEFVELLREGSSGNGVTTEAPASPPTATNPVPAKT